MANTFIVRLGPSNVDLDSANFTLNVWNKDGSGIDTITDPWSWSQLARGTYLVTVPLMSQYDEGFYDLYETNGLLWAQGDITKRRDWQSEMAMRAIYYQPSGGEYPYMVEYHDYYNAPNAGYLTAGNIFFYARPYFAANDDNDVLLGTLSPGDPNTEPATYVGENVTVDYPALLIIEFSEDFLATSGYQILQFGNTYTEERERLSFRVSAYANFPGKFAALSNGQLVDASDTAGGVRHTGLSVGPRVWQSAIDGAPASLFLLHTAYARDLLGCPIFDETLDPADSFVCTSTGDMSELRLHMAMVDERDATWTTLYTWNGTDWTKSFTESYTTVGKFALRLGHGGAGASAQSLTFIPTVARYNAGVPFTVHLPSISSGGTKWMYFDKHGWPIDASGDYVMQPTAPPSAAEIVTEIDTTSSLLDEIRDDTNELQGDLTDGGRLDLLIDAAAAGGGGGGSSVSRPEGVVFTGSAS